MLYNNIAKNSIKTYFFCLFANFALQKLTDFNQNGFPLACPFLVPSMSLATPCYKLAINAKKCNFRG